MSEESIRNLVVTLVLLSAGLAASRSPRRWPYLLFLGVGAAYLPLEAGLAPAWRSCELSASAASLLLAAANVRHVVLFGALYLLSATWWSGPHRELAAAALATLFGGLVEAEQAVFGLGHCRARDLVPDLLGIALAEVGRAAWLRLRAHRGSGGGPRLASSRVRA